MIGLTHRFRKMGAVALVLGVVALSSCTKPNETPDVSASLPDATMTIGAGGGTVTVDSPDSAIDGLSLSVPQGAVPDGTTFSISSQPYGGTVPASSTALTPLL